MGNGSELYININHENWCQKSMQDSLQLGHSRCSVMCSSDDAVRMGEPGSSSGNNPGGLTLTHLCTLRSSESPEAANRLCCKAAVASDLRLVSPFCARAALHWG